MAKSLLDKEGLLQAGPSTSNEDNFESIFNESMELDVDEGNDDLLEQDNEEIESSQKSPPAKRHRREGKSFIEPKSVPPINRKRRYSTANWSAEDKMFHAEQAIKTLKRHTENGTCQKTLNTGQELE